MNQNQSKLFNKGISASIGILIIVICAILAGGILVWQLGLFKEVKMSEVKVLEKEEAKTPGEKISKIEWEALVSEIRSVLEKEASEAGLNEKTIEERSPISIYKKADITDDDTEEALVDWGTGGAYTSYLTLIRISREGRPITSRFKEENGEVSSLMFLAGASVRHGANVEMLSDKKAIYSIAWSTDDLGKIENCMIRAYQWNVNSELFEFDKNLSREIAEKECPRIKSEIEIPL